MIKYPFYIFLLSFYPALSLYAANMQELALLDAIIYACASLILVVCLFYLLNLFFKDREKTALYLVVFLLVFFYFGLFRQYFYGLNPEIFKTKYLLPLVFLLLILLLIWMKKSLYRYDFIAPPLNVFSVIILFMVVLQIGFNYKNVVWSFEVQIERNESNVQLAKSKTMPNVYFIILDEYAAFGSIKQIYGYDNDNFKEFLTTNGFFVAENSHTKFAKTIISIPSVLNMKYVNANADMGIGLSLYKQNVVFKKFISLDYSIASFGLFTHTNQGYEKYYKYKNPFLEYLGQNSILEVYIRRQVINQFYDGDKKIFQELIHLTNNKSQFIFLHLLLPHIPFRYLENGEHQVIYNVQNYSDKNVYLEQYIYATNKIHDLIVDIQKKDPDGIIILQSDHGSRSAYFANKLDVERESHYILNAIYMPNADYEGLKDDMENVDTFKILLPKIEKYIKEKE
ncbi:sulfatase-like hydrolase/transferase [Sulfuricurvum sp.]|uniref:sulfatase-like hydrolase/transferase n=1 Tax=Sulfuricurvum sp. TaxID=2025608 RepID=UPI003BB52A88